MTGHTLLGKKAPEISLLNFDGSTYTFVPGQSGRPTAIFFYPQSGTLGCTREACQFRDALSEEEVFKATNVEVVGISPDPVEKQKKFVEKHSLTYPVLSDENGEARKAYHVSKGFLGLTSSSRVTFVIDAEGVIKDVLDTTLSFSTHQKFVLNWLKTLDSSKVATTSSAPEITPAPGATEPSPAGGEVAAATMSGATTEAKEASTVPAPTTTADPATAGPATA